MEENAVIKGKLLRGDMCVFLFKEYLPSNMVTYCYKIIKKIFSEGDNSAFVHTSHQKKNLIFNTTKESLYIKVFFYIAF